MQFDMNLFRNRSEQVMRLISHWPIGEAAKYGDLFEDYQSGRIASLHELEQAIKERDSTKYVAPPSKPVVWEGREDSAPPIGIWGQR